MCFQEITQHARDFLTSLDLTVNIIGGFHLVEFKAPALLLQKKHNNNMVDQRNSQIVARTSYYIQGFKKTLNFELQVVVANNKN